MSNSPAARAKRAKPVTGTVFDIQRFSIHDGPGIRTTVFLKGCPLRCLWCHNPESYERRPQLSFNPTLCIGCGYCFRTCNTGAHIMVDGVHRIDREKCQECFACLEECYSRALEIAGKEMTVAETLAEVLKDKPFYDQSEGGMTVSGGEPMMQFAFLKELLEAARREGLHTCVETCGVGRPSQFEAIAPLVNLFLFDYKETDPQIHKEFTGLTNGQILRNLRLLDRLGAAIELRCPLIPGINLRDDHLEAIAALARSLKHCARVTLMGYHRLGEAKRERFGLPPQAEALREVCALSGDDLEIAREKLRALGVANVK